MDFKNIVIDIDGVLTDNKVWYDQNGNRTKGFNSSDIWAIRQLISNGYRVVLVTASSWPGIDEYARRTGAEVMVERDKSSIAMESYICVINDIWDFGIAEKANGVFYPSDAIPWITNKFPNAKMIPCKGGDGVIAHLISFLF